MRRFLIVIAAAMCALMLLAGCGASRDYATTESTAYDGGNYYGSAEYEVAEEVDVEGAGSPAPAADVADAAARGVETPDYGGRKVIRNIYMSLDTDAFDDDMQSLLGRVAELGGYTESSTVDGRKPENYNDSGRTGYFVFRIPADKVDEFAAAAQGCGTLISYSENAEDITSQYFDIDTRLSVLRTQLDRLTTILVDTDNLADIIALEQEIADVTLEIEELTTELRRYDGLIDYATVTVNLYEERLYIGPAAEKTVGERIKAGFTDSLYGVGTFFADAFVWLVSALPILVLLAGIGVGLFFIIRGGKKRRAKRAQRKAAMIYARNGQYAPAPQAPRNTQSNTEENHE